MKFHDNVFSTFPRQSRDRNPFYEEEPRLSKWARRAYWIAVALAAAVIGATAVIGKMGT